MGHHHSSAIFLTALLLSSAVPFSNSLGLTLNGQLCCTSTGNCPGQGVAGAPILLNCTNILGGAATVGQTTTGPTGAFNMTIPFLSGLILGLPIIPCTVVVQLPIEGVVCPVLSTATGVLSSSVQLVGTVVSSVLGLLQNATVTGFTHVGV